jgi:hypothetical protein
MEKCDATPAIGAFPDRIHDNVFHTGFHSESSFGATSYLIALADLAQLDPCKRFFRGPLPCK